MNEDCKMSDFLQDDEKANAVINSINKKARDVACKEMTELRSYIAENISQMRRTSDKLGAIDPTTLESYIDDAFWAYMLNHTTLRNYVINTFGIDAQQIKTADQTIQKHIEKAFNSLTKKHIDRFVEKLSKQFGQQESQEQCDERTVHLLSENAIISKS